MGTGLRSGTARFLTGSLPSAPWEVLSSALQTHEGHHLLQLEGQPLFPGCVVLLQCTHNLFAGQGGKHGTPICFQFNSYKAIRYYWYCISCKSLENSNFSMLLRLGFNDLSKPGVHPRHF
ncbi:hypothetical protein ATANTOWER_004059 [Ataeniobius toweri]|uniref:Uncharacterized protein n=1 Tax=Ataeniobius toweri TaxID=208326 RepID=A0ABU7C681_9TELE|nr:hypothetical protein [Ataeniobius toweri]